MREDLIVAEIRKFRAEHAARYGHDLDRICKALREKQAKSKRKVVSRGPRFLLQKTDSQGDTPPDRRSANASRYTAPMDNGILS